MLVDSKDIKARVRTKKIKLLRNILNMYILMIMHRISNNSQTLLPKYSWAS